MTRKELINEIANSIELTKVDTKQVVMAYEKIVGEALSKGDDVSLLGFGKFAVVKRAARQYRNLHTRGIIEVPAKNVVKFKVGKCLAEAVE